MSRQEQFQATSSSKNDTSCDQIAANYLEAVSGWPAASREDIKCKETKTLISNWLYVDELKPTYFYPIVRDETIDERLANLVYWFSSKFYLSDFYKFNSGDKEIDAENEKLVAGPMVDDAKCNLHLNQMLASIDELEMKLEQRRNNTTASAFKFEPRQIRLARLLDTFGRYESGHLSGRTLSMGDYEGCKITPLALDPTKPDELTNSRYCWARLSIDKHLNPVLKSRSKSQYEGSSPVLQTGICIPETCHSRHFKQHKQLFQRLVNGQFKLPSSIYVEQALDIESIFCVVDEQSQIGVPTSGKVLLGLLAGWLLVAVYASSQRDKVELLECKWLRSLLRCLDLKKSWQEFVMVSSDAKNKSNQEKQHRKVELNTLNPIKCFGCAFVVWSHTILVKGGYAQNYFYGIKRIESEYLGGFLLAGPIVVDTFFAITAMIAVFILMKRADRTKIAALNCRHISLDHKDKTTVTHDDDHRDNRAKDSPKIASYAGQTLKIIGHRYLRLIPMLTLAHWFKRSVFISMGSGPLWDYGFNQETYTGACRQESWLVPLTFSSAFLPLSKQCLIQSWSISNDMFFFLICTPIILIMVHRPKTASVIVVGLSIASMLATYMSFLRLDSIGAFEMSDLRLFGFMSFVSRLSYLYSYPHYRIVAFAVGLLAGYLLYKYEKEEWKEWPWWIKGAPTKLALIYIVAIFALSNTSLTKKYIAPHHYIIGPYNITLGRLFWALSNCILFLRMMTDWNRKYFMQISASKFWSAASKLNYLLLLIHYDLLIFNETNPYQTNTMTFWSAWQGFSVVYLTTAATSVLVYVILENPIDKMVKTFLTGQKS